MISVEICTAAVINIASDAIYMKIAQNDENDEIKEIESLESPVNIGKEVFTDGKISYENVENICAILKNYRKKITEYGIKDVITIATTALREAQNSRFVAEQIKSRTKFDIEILDDTEEKTIIYKEMIRFIEKNPKYKSSNIIMSYIGTGSLGIAYFSQGNILFNHNIKVGTLKLAEILGELNTTTNSYYKIVQEYLSSFVVTLNNSFRNEKIDYFIAAGREIRFLSKIINSEETDISLDDFNKFLNDIKNKTINQITLTHKIPSERSEILLASMGIYSMLLKISGVENIGILKTGLMDALLFNDIYSEKANENSELFVENIVKSAYILGEKYHFDTEHAVNTEKYALKIFSEIQNVHKLSGRDRLLLRISAILHDVGKFINLKSHSFHSYNVIRASDLPGLNIRDIEIISNVARLHSKSVININEDALRLLTNKERIKIAKILAILRLADALDRSHSGKVKDIRTHLSSGNIVLDILSEDDLTLEQWTFNKKSEFFEEVFGMKISMKKTLE